MDRACPCCVASLDRLAVEGGGIVWTCRECGGAALGVSLLRRCAPRATVNPLWLDARERAAEGAACPGCREPMVDGLRGGDVAACTTCQLVWLGSPGVLPDLQITPVREPLNPLARQALAVAQVHEMATRDAAEEAQQVEARQSLRFWGVLMQLAWAGPLAAIAGAVRAVRGERQDARDRAEWAQARQSTAWRRPTERP